MIQVLEPRYQWAAPSNGAAAPSNGQDVKKYDEEGYEPEEYKDAPRYVPSQIPPYFYGAPNLARRMYRLVNFVAYFKRPQNAQSCCLACLIPRHHLSL